MDVFQEAKHWLKNSITLKLLVIGILVLILLIPAEMIKSLINERSLNWKGAISEVTDKWGDRQVITGPILTIPYKEVDMKDGKPFEYLMFAHFLPEKLNIAGKVNPEIRKRSIYKVILYNTKLSANGYFGSPDFAALNIKPENVIWREAFLTIGIPDMRGIRRSIEINWNNKKYVGNPGVLNKQIVESGINTKVEVSPDSGQYQFSFNMDLNGSEYLGFVPLGKETHTILESTWDSPGFTGAFLPEKRQINKTGFNAEWNILHLNRNYPQQWTSDDKHEVSQSAYGVELISTVDHYQKSMRSAKYAVMFLFLTFLVFFITEIINKSRIHPVQYLLIGISLLIFYTLLISLSEYIGFNFAYTLASLATITLITGYALSVVKKRKAGFLIGAFLLALYGFLFVLLQLEDLSLLIGSIGLFIIIATVMYVSRKVDWYSPVAGKNN
ncbi:MAG TPA: cell envelope integrity protein CreD [Bacteroidales bacterium]